MQVEFSEIKPSEILLLTEVADLFEFRKRLVAGKKDYLIGFGMESCNACKAVKLMMAQTLSVFDFSNHPNASKSCFFIWFDLNEPEQLEEIGVNILEIPTLLGFRGELVIAGWSGLTIGDDNQIPDGFNHYRGQEL
jgi:hypothetical protein